MSTAEDSNRQLVVTNVADTLCGIAIDAVHEIIPLQGVTAVPRSPRNLLGVTNVRGVVVPVADLRACLGYDSAEATAETRIVLVTYHDEKIGLIVDAVTEVLTLSSDAFESVKETAAHSDYLHAIVRSEGRLILDIDHACVLEHGLDAEPSELVELYRAEEEAPVVTANETSESDNTQETDGAGESGLNVELLESSFSLLAPKGEELVGRFYERLFETAPQVRGLFPDDMKGQETALLGALGMTVKALRSPDTLVPLLEGLGRRHVGYGAVAAHYDVVGDVLIATMAEYAGDVWNDELQQAWTEALAAVKEIMLSGAEQAEKQAA